MAIVGGLLHESRGGNGQKGEEEGEREENERKKEVDVDENGDAAVCGEEVRTDLFSLQFGSGGRRGEMSGGSGQSGGGGEGKILPVSVLGHYVNWSCSGRLLSRPPPRMSPAQPQPQPQPQPQSQSQPSTYASKHPESTSHLLNALRNLHATDPKAIRTTVHRYPAALYTHGQNDHARDRLITSWKMTEHMYFKKSLVFPTLARGLFTEEVLEGDPVPPLRECSDQARSDPNALKERIVLRGYDKFFNIGEVAWTEVGLCSALRDGLS